MKLKDCKVSSKFTLQRSKLPNQNKGKEALLFNKEEPTAVKITEEKQTEQPQPKIKRAKKETIEEFTARILEGFNSYTREEILDKIIKDTAVDKARAFKGFIKMRKDKTIFKTYLQTYYLSSSAPF